jgi:hypothetical protein
MRTKTKTNKSFAPRATGLGGAVTMLHALTKMRAVVMHAATVLLTVMLTATVQTAWAQKASSSEGWVITKSDNDTKCKILRFNGEVNNVTIFPAVIDGAAVVEYTTNNDYGLFKTYPNLETIYLYEGFQMSEIPSAHDCKSLKHIHVVDADGNIVKEDELPAAITSIPDGAFHSTKIEKLNMPNVTSIGKSAFSLCGKISNVFFPALTSIGESSFFNCLELKQITIPDGLTNLGDGTFGYSGLTSIEIPNSVTIIGAGTFAACHSLETITIPASVTEIGERAFMQCSDLKSATINAKITTIADQLFCNCISLESLTIPASVTHIGNNAFAGCSKLASITIPASVATIGTGAFANSQYYESGLTSATIIGHPTIGDGAFPQTATLSLNLTPTAVGSEYWMTFCDNYANFQADNQTTVYKATEIGGRLALTEVKDRIVNKGTAVLLKRTNTGNIVMTSTSTASSDLRANDLTGTETELDKIRNKEYDYYYTITIQSDPESYGTATASASLAPQGAKITVSAVANAGYEFLGWEASGTGGIVHPFKAATTFTMGKKDATITARFREVNTVPEGTYHLTLYPNTGDYSDAAQVLSGSTSYQLPSRQRDGYVFLGWATSANASIADLDPDFEPGKTVTLVANLTLYGIWSPARNVSISVTNSEGGTVTLTDANNQPCGSGIVASGIYSLTVKPQANYRFNGSYKLTGGGAESMPEEINGYTTSTYTLDLREKDVTVSVTFIYDETLPPVSTAYALSGEYVSFYPEEGYDNITEANAGQTVTVSVNQDDIPTGKYFTGTYSSDDVNVTVDEVGDGTFTMPAKAVTVNAVLGDQEEYTLDVSTTTPQIIPESVYLLMNSQVGYFGGNMEGNMWLDINLDGTDDLQLTESDGSYTVTRLPGADGLTKNYRFTYPMPYRYNSLLVKLGNDYEVQQQIRIDEELTDSDPYDSNNSLIAMHAESQDEGPINVLISGRTLYKDGDWNTLCLPFPLASLTGTPLEGASVKTLSSTDYNGTTQTLTLDFTTATGIEAGKPYIVKWPQGTDIVNPIFSGVTLVEGLNPVATTYADFTGSYAPVSFEADNKSVLCLGPGNKLYYPSTAITMGAFRGYFRLKDITAGDLSSPAHARRFVLNFDDEDQATGIISLKAGSGQSAQGASAADWFMLDGRRLSTAPKTKGIYIHQGKKTIIK